MGIRVQALPKQLPRQVVTVKTNRCLQKRSMSSPLYGSLHSLTRFRLSREEREAAYIKARERIFGANAEKTGDATPGMIV
jgi:hypothetical protein